MKYSSNNKKLNVRFFALALLVFTVANATNHYNAFATEVSKQAGESNKAIQENKAAIQEHQKAVQKKTVLSSADNSGSKNLAPVKESKTEVNNNKKAADDIKKASKDNQKATTEIREATKEIKKATKEIQGATLEMEKATKESKKLLTGKNSQKNQKGNKASKGSKTAKISKNKEKKPAARPVVTKPVETKPVVAVQAPVIAPVVAKPPVTQAKLPISSDQSAPDGTLDYGTLYVMEQAINTDRSWRFGMSFASELNNQFANVYSPGFSIEHSVGNYVWLGVLATTSFSSETAQTEKMRSDIRDYNTEANIQVPKYSVYPIATFVPFVGHIGFLGMRPLGVELEFRVGAGMVQFSSPYSNSYNVFSTLWSIRPAIRFDDRFSLQFGIGQEIRSLFSTDQRVFLLRGDVGVAVEF